MNTRKLCVFLAIIALGLLTKANPLWVLLMCGLVELVCVLKVGALLGQNPIQYLVPHKWALSSNAMIVEFLALRGKKEASNPQREC
jgi:hypothetical protein